MNENLCLAVKHKHMRKPWKIAVIIVLAAIVLILIGGGLYINNIEYNNVKNMYKLYTSDQKVIFVEKDNDGNRQYLTRVAEPDELLKERMKNDGWKFIRQDGAGYFFEKDNQEAIITIKKWNHKYFIYKVPNITVNIEG